ncbi:transporter [Pseudomonas sp. R5(2019)]|uniref:SphA family protein n=1 Tax=Pseudomonas sp. R5(2019) TaxID=2697566 RepID=UPI00141266DF|nr:transporter [Pseudomonas sp. R5(2019)]NBA93637.1 phenol degradation protein meta [Pseudomonas sp. R5(2019)]
MLRVSAVPLRTKFLSSCTACLLLTGTQAFATEYNGTAYPLGLDTALAGRMPPPGLTTFLYASAYESNELKDTNGHSKAGIEDFMLRYQALAVCLDYVYSDYSLLGGTLASRAALPFIKGEVSFYANTPQGRVRYRGKSEGFANVAVTPLFLGWGSSRYHQMVGVDFYLPTGSYDKDRLFNAGTNVLSYSPWFSLTAHPIENWEMSAKILYMVNGKNDATNYTSGDEVIADYHLGYSVSSNWQIGMSGYLYKQVSDDESHGLSVGDDGNRGRVLAYGPSLKYQTPAFGVLVKWQHETQVENRAKGERIWLQAVLRF